MMLFLIGDVSLHGLYARRTHAKRSVSLLPREQRRMFPHHPAGIRLQHSRRVADREIGRQHNQHVHMIGNSADGDGADAMVARDPGKVISKARLRIGRDELRAILGGEDDVEDGTDVAVWHACCRTKNTR